MTHTEELSNAAKEAAAAIKRLADLAGCAVDVGFTPADACFVSDRYCIKLGGLPGYNMGRGMDGNVDAALSAAFADRERVLQEMEDRAAAAAILAERRAMREAA